MTPLTMPVRMPSAEGRGLGSSAVSAALRTCLLLWLCAGSAQAADLDEIKLRVVALQTAGGADPSAPEAAAAITDLCASAQSLVDTLQPDGRWADLTYGDPPGGPGWPLGLHYGRIHRIAQAWRSSVCPDLSASADVARKLGVALAAGQPFFCAQCAGPGNWWWWNIGVPLDLAPALVLLEGGVDPPTFAAALDSLDANVAAQTELSGANLADHAMNSLLIALLRGDGARATVATHEMEQLCVITPHGLPFVEEDGIKSDFSFHQHQGQLSTGAYGQVFVDEVARFITLTDGTAFALDGARLATFGDFLLYGTVWSIYGDDFDDNVIGRGFSREGNHAGGALGAVLRLAFFDPSSERQQQLLAAARQLVSAWRYGYSLELAPLVARLRAAPDQPGWPQGHRHYPDSDFTVHRRPGWYSSVRMLSTRMLSGENTNQEGKRGARQSDGRLVLLLEGDEYQGDVRPTLDQARLPGITVELSPGAESATYGAGVRSFVGGTGDGVDGLSAMDFAPAAPSDSKLSAKKSWFFFDDAIVFLASGIDCPTGNDVQTIVEQWPLRTLDAPLVADGVAQPVGAGWTAGLDATWLAADGLGYWFPGGARVNASRLVQRGRWSDLGVGRDTLLEHPVLTLWLDHGANPVGASAAYAIVPRVDAAGMAAWVAQAPLEILANSRELAAVKNTLTGELGAVFWKAGALGELKTNAPLVLWATHGDGSWKLNVADPGQLRESVSITLTGAWDLAPGLPSSQDLTVTTAGGDTRVDFRVKDGQTVSASLLPHRVPVGAPRCGSTPGASTGVLLVALLLRRRRRSRVSGSSDTPRS
jgi:hyaluronate lyase